MGMFDKLFGKKQASSGSGRISMGAINLQQGHGLNVRTCDICSKSFPCPERTQTVLTEDTDRFSLDIGGYCDRCSGYRCPQHSEWLSVGSMTWGMSCSRCGQRLRGAT